MLNGARGVATWGAACGARSLSQGRQADDRFHAHSQVSDVSSLALAHQQAAFHVAAAEAMHRSYWAWEKLGSRVLIVQTRPQVRKHDTHSRFFLRARTESSIPSISSCCSCTCRHENRAEMRFKDATQHATHMTSTGKQLLPRQPQTARGNGATCCSSSRIFAADFRASGLVLTLTFSLPPTSPPTAPAAQN